jgi:HEAT repeat protein
MTRLPVTVFAVLFVAFGDQASRLRAADEPEFNGRKLSAWATQLREDTVPRKRRAAVVALGRLADDHKDCQAEVLQHLGRALKTDAAVAVREQAATTIGQQKIDANAGGVLADLAESMRSEKEPSVRREVAASLGRFGPASKQAVQPLTAALTDPDAGVRAAAADALGRVGADAKASATELLPLLKDGEKSVRQAAVFALGRVGPDDPAPVSAALVGVLAGSDPDLRREALGGLSLLGDRSPEVVSAVAGVLADPDAELRQQAVLALARFGPAARAAEDALKRSFKDDVEKQVRSSAVHTLCMAYGTDAKTLIPLMTERLKADPDFEVRVVVAEELGTLGADGRAAVPALREAQRDSQIKVREAAAAAVKRIERSSSPSKPDR